jgi:hypothetical protein
LYLVACFASNDKLKGNNLGYIMEHENSSEVENSKPFDWQAQDSELSSPEKAEVTELERADNPLGNARTWLLRDEVGGIPADAREYRPTRGEVTKLDLSFIDQQVAEFADEIDSRREHHYTDALLHDGGKDAYHPKFYGTNNGVFTAVNGEEVRVGLMSEATAKALQEQGYEYKEIGVYFSNGELPADPGAQQHWSEMHYRYEAEREGVVLVEPGAKPEGSWEPYALQVDSGLSYVIDQRQAQLRARSANQQKPSLDGESTKHVQNLSPLDEGEAEFYNHYSATLVDIGKYDLIDNEIVFCDSNGQHWRGANSEATVADLKSQGYKQGPVSPK